MKAYLIALLVVCIAANTFLETHDGVTCPRGSELLDVYAGRLGLSVTYSSIYGSSNSYTYSRLGSQSAWSAARNDGNQWIQIASPNRLKWIGVETQGRANTNQWVKSYKVYSSDDGTNWEEVDEGHTFTGNSDRNTHVKHWFDTPRCARAIRLVPTSWYRHISARVDFIFAQRG